MQRGELISIAFLHGFPASFCRSGRRRSGTPSAQIFDAYCDEVRTRIAELPAWIRWIAIAQWPLSVTFAALWMVATNGVFATRAHGRGIAAQFADQLRLAFSLSLSPQHYYLWELHDAEKRAGAEAYIPRGQVKGAGCLYKRFYRANRERNASVKVLNDKVAFARFLESRGLPVPVLYARAEAGRLTFEKPDLTVLPQTELFVKPRSANGGEGAELWTWEEGRYLGCDGQELSREALTERLAERSQETSLLVHECLRNHPDLKDLSAGALSTLRMYTCSNERGEAEHLFTMLRMSQRAGCVVDNICKGGLAAAVDPRSGRLGLATDSAPRARGGWRDRHPVTGARIAGRELPCWKEALRLALAGHEAFAEAAVIGWDIGITERGPVIVEGNKAPDITIEQRLIGGWANQRMGEIFAFHLEAGRRAGAKAAGALHGAA